MVTDVTETRNVIPSLGFKTCMTIKSYVFTVLSRFEFEYHTNNAKNKKLPPPQKVFFLIFLSNKINKTMLQHWSKKQTISHKQRNN